MPVQGQRETVPSTLATADGHLAVSGVAAVSGDKSRSLVDLRSIRMAAINWWSVHDRRLGNQRALYRGKARGPATTRRARVEQRDDAPGVGWGRRHLVGAPLCFCLKLTALVFLTKSLQHARQSSLGKLTAPSNNKQAA